MPYSTDPLRQRRREVQRLRDILERILAITTDPAHAESLALADVRRLCREGLRAAEPSTDDWTT